MFRAANERIADVAEGLIDPVPFICECGRRSCTTMIRARLDEYERVRAVPTQFLYAPGHDEGLPASLTVDRLEHALVVEKRGEAREVALATDPRRGT